MSATIKLSSKLPGDPEINGLDSISHRFIDDPEDVIVAIVWLKTVKTETYSERGDDQPEEVPTVRLARVEPIGGIESTPSSITKLAADRYRTRTGRDPIPFDQVIGSRRDDDEEISTSGQPGPTLLDDGEDLVDAEVIDEDDDPDAVAEDSGRGYDSPFGVAYDETVDRDTEE